MHDELATLIGEYNKTSKYIDKWYKNNDEIGNLRWTLDRKNNPKYGEFHYKVPETYCLD